MVDVSISSSQMSKWQLSTESQNFKDRTQKPLYQWSIALLSKLAVKDWGRVRFDVDEGDGFVAPVTQTKYICRIRSKDSLNSKSGMHNFLSHVRWVDSMIF